MITAHVSKVEVLKATTTTCVVADTGTNATAGISANTADQGNHATYTDGVGISVTAKHAVLIGSDRLDTEHLASSEKEPWLTCRAECRSLRARCGPLRAQGGRVRWREVRGSTWGLRVGSRVLSDSRG